MKTAGRWLRGISIVVSSLAWISAAGARPAKPVEIALPTPAGEVRVEMPREHLGDGDAAVLVHAPDRGIERIVLHYESAGRWLAVPLNPPAREMQSSARPEEGPRVWRGTIAHQERGTQISYYVTVEPAGAQALVAPAGAPAEPARITFKGRPSIPVLVAHILAMMGGLVPLAIAFVAAWIYLVRRRGLAVLRRSVLIGLVMLFLGAVPLGMVIEYQVFGTWWEGWPFGRDVTDTKTGVLLVAWLALVLARGKEIFSRAEALGRPRDRAWAVWVIVLGAVTAGFYLIPHENIKF